MSSNLFITGINMTVPRNEFKDHFSKYAKETEDYFTDLSLSMDYDEMSSTRGKKLYRIDFEAENTGSNNTTKASILCYRNDSNGDMEFEPLHISSYGGFFTFDNYGEFNDDYCAGFRLIDFLIDLAKKYKGDIAGIIGQEPFLYRKGKQKKGYSAVVTQEGDVFSIRNGKSLDIHDDSGIDNSLSFHINKPINEWRDENPEVLKAMREPIFEEDEDGNITERKRTLAEKMDVVGKILIKQKLSDELTSDDFIDLFRQAGMLGMSDNTMNMIFKLIM